MPLDDDAVINTRQAAELAGVGVRTIRRWANTGRLYWLEITPEFNVKGIPRDQQGYRFRAGDVLAAAASRDPQAVAMINKRWQRPVNQARVDELAQTMKRGEWTNPT